MQNLTLSHPPNAVIAESVPKRTLAEVSQFDGDLKFFSKIIGVVYREDIHGRGRRSRVCGPSP